VHKLQKGSFLGPIVKTVYQVLNEKILKLSVDDANNIYKHYQSVFARVGEQVSKELSSATTPITLFVPIDNAFKSLRPDQISALVADERCAYKFITYNIVYEEVCPNQLAKYNSDYASTSQQASFVSVSENSSNTVIYFNGQIVHIPKYGISMAANGAIYRLSTIRLSGVIDFLYDVVQSFKKKIATSFLNGVGANWLDVIKSESTDTTLLLPFEEKHTTPINPVSSAAASATVGDALSPLTTAVTMTAITATANMSTTTSTLSTAIASPPANLTGLSSPNGERINIYDYIIKPKYTFYQLNDGDILTSVSNKKYLINVYPFDTAIPEYLSFIPVRNFQRKTINCQQLEMSDIAACSSQLIVFKSERHSIQPLDTITVLEYIEKDSELTVFNMLINHCGKECKEIFKNLRAPSQQQQQQRMQNSSLGQRRSGYTLILPVNDYFSRTINNFNKYSKNTTLLKRTIDSNIFYGTYCFPHIRSESLIENMLNRRLQSKKIHSRIIKPNQYLDINGIIVHKSGVF
jgi:hypothetical protein